jgi:Tol biopolymer transport system component
MGRFSKHISMGLAGLFAAGRDSAAPIVKRSLFVAACCTTVWIPSLAQAADRVLFLRIAPTKAGLYLSQADGSGEHALAPSTSLDYDPAWSPKGDWIAFSSERNGSADLYRVHPDGTGLERLTDNPAYEDQAAFSPDEKQIVFVSTRAEGFANLWILDVATRRQRPLTAGQGGDFRPAWSPDGKWIAFSSDRDSDLPSAKGRWERLHIAGIYLVHPDGTGLRRLTAMDENFCGSPKWSADSKSVIAYCMKGQDTWENRAGNDPTEDSLQQVDVATGIVKVLKAGPGLKEAPFPLAGGDTGFLRRDGGEQGIFYASGKPGPRGGDIRVPACSPDGKQVVFSRFTTNRRPEPARLWSRNPTIELYTTTWLPAVDTARGRIATTNRDGGMSDLFVVDGDQPARSILRRQGLILAPQWSADGKQIVVGVGNFSSFLDFTMGNKKPVDPVNGGGQVAVLNADGSGYRPLTSGPNNNAFASFAPDGKSIVYRTAGPEGDGLRIMTLADHSIRRLTGTWDNFAIWSPKGDRIAFVRRIGHDFQIFTIHPDGSGEKQLTHIRGNHAHLAWLPDGDHLLFTSSMKGFKDEAPYTGAPQPYGEIFMMRADGTDLEQLTDDQWEEGGPAWLPGTK